MLVEDEARIVRLLIEFTRAVDRRDGAAQANRFTADPVVEYLVHAGAGRAVVAEPSVGRQSVVERSERLAQAARSRPFGWTITSRPTT